MSNFKIFCSHNSELTEFEASSRGYRADVFVKTISGNLYHLHVYDIIRLSQDFEMEFESHGFFGIEPNVILVKEVVWKDIKLTVENLFKQKFFDSLKPMNSNEIDLTALVEV